MHSPTTFCMFHSLVNMCFENAPPTFRSGVLARGFSLDVDADGMVRILDYDIVCVRPTPETGLDFFLRGMDTRIAQRCQGLTQCGSNSTRNSYC
mmetsp:Transcript_48072/g.145180  ORF Transcript_48072/g.145180 Transcript_48072/m.145180 type:complete len:94 (+) Transcript_48072:752-1033(+)